MTLASEIVKMLVILNGTTLKIEAKLNREKTIPPKSIEAFILPSPPVLRE